MIDNENANSIKAFKVICGDIVGCLRMTSYRPLELAAVFYMGHGVYKWENIIGGHSRAPLS